MPPLPMASSTPQHLTSEPEREDDSQATEYEARGILDERVIPGGAGKGKRRKEAREYLVDWEGTDEHGEPYSPTWEPEENCSDVLLGNWKRRTRQDPGVIGRWTREQEETKRAGGKGKRKRIKEEGVADEESPKRVKGKQHEEATVTPASTKSKKTGLASQNGTPQSTASRAVTTTRLRKGSSARPAGLAGPSAGAGSSQSPQVSKRPGNGGGGVANANGKSGESSAGQGKQSGKQRHISVSDDEDEDADESELVLRRKGKHSALVQSGTTTQETSARQSPPSGSAAQDAQDIDDNDAEDDQDQDPAANLPESQAQAYYQLLTLLRDGDDEEEAAGSQDASDAQAAKEAVDNAQRNKDPGGMMAANANGGAEGSGSSIKPVTVADTDEDTAAAQLALAPPSSQDAFADDLQAEIAPEDDQIRVTVSKTQVTFASQPEREDTSIVESTPQEGSSGDRTRSQVEPEPATQATQATVEDPDVPDDVLMTDAEAQAREVAVEAALESGNALAGPSTIRNTAVEQAEPTGSADPPAEVIALKATLAQRDETILALEMQVQTLKASVKSVASDLEFHRTMYSDASNKAYGLAGDLKTSRDEVKKLKQQLDFGLKQRDLLYSGGFEARDNEIAQLKRQVELLLQQSRNTDDRVRARAQDYPAALATIRRLQEDMAMQQTMTRKYKQIAQIAEARSKALLGKTFGKLPMVWDSDDEEEADRDFMGGESSEDDDTDETVESEEQVDGQAGAPGPTDTAAEVVAEQAIVDVDAAALAAAVTAASVPEQQLSQGESPGWFMCKWSDTPGVKCGLMFRTQQEMENHIAVHV